MYLMSNLLVNNTFLITFFFLENIILTCHFDSFLLHPIYYLLPYSAHLSILSTMNLLPPKLAMRLFKMPFRSCTQSEWWCAPGADILWWIYLVDGQCVYMHYTIYKHAFIFNQISQPAPVTSVRSLEPALNLSTVFLHSSFMRRCEWGSAPVVHNEYTWPIHDEKSGWTRSGAEDASDRIYTWLHYRIGIKKKHHVSP